MAIGKTPCACGGPMHRGAVRCGKCRDARNTVTPALPVTVAVDRSKQRAASELHSLKQRYDESLRIIDRQEKELRAVGALSEGLETTVIKPKHSTGTSEATAVIVASDWHVEERVEPGTVSGLNEFNLDIAKQRAERFFQSGLRLVKLLQQDVKITTVVLALLGDFISNDIHEDFPEINGLQPNHALVLAQNLLASGIDFLLANSTVDLVIPCHSGNHARTTRTTRFGAENGHSLEYLMYLHLATHFKNEPRVTFIIPDGMHSYVDIYGYTIRFQHGHAIKYGGGVGGIYVPVNKAIAQWDRARRADLNCFGHFHQMVDGGTFVANGSLIGYSSFALSIKGSFEQPKQALFLIDKKRGKTCVWPLFVGET